MSRTLRIRRLRAGALAALGLPLSAIACGGGTPEPETGGGPADSADTAIEVEAPADEPPSDEVATQLDEDAAVPERTQPTVSKWQPPADGSGRRSGCTVERAVPDGTTASRYGDCPMHLYPVGTQRVSPGQIEPRPPQALATDNLYFHVGLTDEARANGADNACCYRTPSPRPIIRRGRPVRDRGEQLTAAPMTRSDWLTELELPPASGLSDAERAELAQYWSEAGAEEHASVAAFNKLTLELMALGAPPELLDGCQRAAGDEVRHATIGYALARRYGGRTVGPSPLELSTGTHEDADELAKRIARETVLDGCLGETAAAALLREAADAAAEPELARTLTELAEDETRHAELGWEIVAWLAREVPATRSVLAELAESMEPPAHSAPRAEPGDAVKAHGVPGAAAETAVHARVCDEIVRPCLRALLERADDAMLRST